MKIRLTRQITMILCCAIMTLAMVQTHADGTIIHPVNPGDNLKCCNNDPEAECCNFIEQATRAQPEHNENKTILEPVNTGKNSRCCRDDPEAECCTIIDQAPLLNSGEESLPLDVSREVRIPSSVNTPLIKRNSNLNSVKATPVPWFYEFINTSRATNSIGLAYSSPRTFSPNALDDGQVVDPGTITLPGIGRIPEYQFIPERQDCQPGDSDAKKFSESKKAPNKPRTKEEQAEVDQRLSIGCLSSITLLPPWSHERETACSSAAKHLLEMRKLPSGYSTDYSALSKYHIFLRDVKDFPQQYESVLQQYDEHCLFRLSELNEKTCRSHPQFQQVTRGIGQLIDSKSQKAFCSGFHIGNYVLTARHCLIDTATLSIDNQGRASFELIAGELTFKPLFTEHKAFTVSVENAVHPQKYAQNINSYYSHAEASDWVALAAPNAEGKGSDLSILKPQPGDQLMILAAQPNAQRTLNDNTEQNLAFSPSLRLDISPTCHAGVVQKGCLHHSCQTDASMSGSPIFALRSLGVIGLVGIHTSGPPGPEARNRSECVVHHQKVFKNTAVSEFDELLPYLKAP